METIQQLINSCKSEMDYDEIAETIPTETELPANSTLIIEHTITSPVYFHIMVIDNVPDDSNCEYTASGERIKVFVRKTREEIINDGIPILF